MLTKRTVIKRVTAFAHEVKFFDIVLLPQRGCLFVVTSIVDEYISTDSYQDCGT